MNLGCLKLVSLSLMLSLSFACEGSKKNSDTRPEAPRVLVGSNKQGSPSPGVPLKPAPLPPPASNPQPNPNPGAPLLDAAAQEFLSQIQGRWRTSCEETEEGRSHFYGVEFREASWSTLYFEYSDNDACIHMAAPNEGVPRTYHVASMRQESEGAAAGRFTLRGSCLSEANGCIGEQEVRVWVPEDGILRLEKVSGSSLWLDSDQDVMSYDF